MARITDEQATAITKHIEQVTEKNFHFVVAIIDADSAESTLLTSIEEATVVMEVLDMLGKRIKTVNPYYIPYDTPVEGE